MKPKLPSLIKLMPWLCVIVLALMSWYFLVTRNDDVLFMQQLHSLFDDTSVFYHQYLAKPAGLLQWAGCYLTQLLYHPAWGSGVLILLWAALFFLMKKALRITDTLAPLLLIPLVCLLVSEIDLGYWIYYNKNAGYCFSQTLGLLTAALLVLAGRQTCRIEVKSVGSIILSIILSLVGAAVMALLYRHVGIYALTATLTLGVIMLLERRWVSAVLYVAATVAAPFLCRQEIDTLRVDRLFTAGLPLFETADLTNTTLTLPFEIAIGVFVVLSLLYKVGKGMKSRKVATAVSAVLLIAITGGSVAVLSNADYDDANYHAECQAYRDIDEQRWDDALFAIRKVEGTLTRQLIMFKNIALLNTHDIGNSMYDFDDQGMTPTPSDSLKVHMANTAAPLIYLHHGMTNYAYRYSMENQVKFGFSVANLKIMALSAIVSGENQLAEKYLNILSHTMYYKDWAERYMQLAESPRLIGKYPELTNIRDLHSCLGNTSGSDDGICEFYITQHFANATNAGSKYFEEVALAYSVITKDVKKFWPHYLRYLQTHKGEKIPEIYQQAAYLYAGHMPELAPDPKTLHFDKEVVDRYNEFDKILQGLVNSGYSEEEVGEQTKAEFSNTFWWINYFEQDPMCY